MNLTLAAGAAPRGAAGIAGCLDLLGSPKIGLGEFYVLPCAGNLALMSLR